MCLIAKYEYHGKIQYTESSLNHVYFIGVNSFHVFMANVGEQKSLSDSDIYQILKRCKQLGALLTVHAENGCLIEEVSYTSAKW